MSTREIQDIAFKNGIIMFEGGAQNEGMIVPRYNIRLGKIEYFFIPSSRIHAYESAREQCLQDAYRYFGTLVEESTIKSIQ